MAWNYKPNRDIIRHISASKIILMNVGVLLFFLVTFESVLTKYNVDARIIQHLIVFIQMCEPIMYFKSSK